MQILRKPDPARRRNRRDDGEVVAAAVADGGGGAGTKRSNWNNPNKIGRGNETHIVVVVVAAAAVVVVVVVVVVVAAAVAAEADGGCSSSWPAGTIRGCCLLLLRSCSSCLRFRNCCHRLRTADFLNMQITFCHMQMIS